LQNRLLAQVKSQRSINRFRILHGRRYGKSCFGGGAHWIEQAARAITGRLIPQLPARRRFHRTLLISAGPSSWARAAVPYRAVRMAGFDGASAKIRTTIDTLELKMRLATAISN
jgi:hypothetical protein